MIREFSTYHPAVSFGFFCIVICSSFFMFHPVYMMIALAASAVYALLLGGIKVLKFMVCFLLPVIAVSAAVNALVNPRGATVLLYTEDIQITEEALIYGVFTGMMISSVLLWFSCFNRIMTSDKIIYLFGRLMPVISMMISMVMRFIPRFRIQIRKISQAQRCMGRDAGSGSLGKRLEQGMSIMSVMFTWAMENSIDSADSMRARGYGTGRRSFFSTYRFDRRDRISLLIILLFTAVVLAGAAVGSCHMEFYPEIIIPETEGIDVIFYVSYLLLCFFPVIIEAKEVILWKYLQSKI